MHIQADNHVVEQVEQAALDDLFTAAHRASRFSGHLQRMKLDGATLYLAPDQPDNSLLNRVIGLGNDSSVTKDTIIRIRAVYAEAGVRDYFISVQPWARPPQLWNWLFEAGLVRDRGWTQFRRDNSPLPPRETALRVERIERAQSDSFAWIAAEGFGLDVSIQPAIAALVGHPNWHHFMTFDGEEPAGVAALRVESGVAWFDWAATRSEYRGRGSQTALLQARIEAAIGAGCHTLCSETGEAVPGDAQHSFCNLVRAGFSATHTRDNFSPTTA